MQAVTQLRKLNTLTFQTKYHSGGVEDTRLEAKAMDTKKIRGQGHPFQADPLEAKDRNAQGQGPRTQQQVFSKKKGLQKFFSGDLQFIGLARIFDW